MTLKPFTVTFTRPHGWTRTIEVWTATRKAARESAELFGREEGHADARITVTPRKLS